MIFKPLYKKAQVADKINKWTIEVVGNGYRTISGYDDGVQTTTEWTYCQGKNVGKANGTTDEQQALKEAEALYTKRLESGYHMDIAECHVAKFFQPMLAKDWTVEQRKVTFPVYSQPKLDGIRCIVKRDGMWTRNGKPIISAPHIFEALEPLFEINPDLIFDGELYADKFADDFNAICSLVKKTKPTWADLNEAKDKIQYHVYDLPSYNATFGYRYTHLFKLLGRYSPYIEVVDTAIVPDKETLLKMYDIYMERGYEGQMVRLDENYENKRSKSLLKHKSFIDEEYTILDVEEGNGNKAGMVGAFVYETKSGKRFSASPKFNWETCKQMWRERSNLIGKQATVKYFNLTPDGIPRFPYTIAIRDYE